MSKFTTEIPNEIFHKFKMIATEEGYTVNEVFLECLRFGMIGLAIRNRPKERILIENESETKEVIFNIGKKCA